DKTNENNDNVDLEDLVNSYMKILDTWAPESKETKKPKSNDSFYNDTEIVVDKYKASSEPVAADCADNEADIGAYYQNKAMVDINCRVPGNCHRNKMNRYRAFVHQKSYKDEITVVEFVMKYGHGSKNIDSLSRIEKKRKES
ncbi:15155_t:CDS:2, partial [Racocetra persica]